MTHFPSKRIADGLSRARAFTKDVLWGKPLFKAPELRSPVHRESLPFTARRVTHHPFER